MTDDDAAAEDDAEAEDDARLAAFALALADGIEATLPGWVERSVERVLTAARGTADPAVMAEARAAGERARAHVAPRVRQLLTADIDQQRTNPLAIIRGATRYPTDVLRAAGVPPVPRDEQARRHFPDDIYDLTPAAFADLDPSLHEPGLLWGAAKAHVHLRRRRADGLR
jgi:signal transduction histidine kinase